jgi:hypothetical protein
MCLTFDPVDASKMYIFWSVLPLPAAMYAPSGLYATE